MIYRDVVLKGWHYDNGSYVDYSNSLANYGRDSITVALNKDEDYFYFGYDRPFNAIYFEFTTPNTNSNTLTVQYYSDAGSWDSLTCIDETKGFTRSGYLSWDRNVGKTQDDIDAGIKEWNEDVTLNSVTDKFWIRIRPSVTHSSTVILGASIIFSDDVDLAKEYWNITDYLGTRTSFIQTHVAARDKIIQDLRDKGAYRWSEDGAKLLTPWDVLEIEDLRYAATCLALSMILFNASDDPAGNLAVKAKFYQDTYKQLISRTVFNLDVDGDGLQTAGENKLVISEGRAIR